MSVRSRRLWPLLTLGIVAAGMTVVFREVPVQLSGQTGGEGCSANEDCDQGWACAPNGVCKYFCAPLNAIIPEDVLCDTPSECVVTWGPEYSFPTEEQCVDYCLAPCEYDGGLEGAPWHCGEPYVQFGACTGLKECNNASECDDGKACTIDECNTHTCSNRMKNCSDGNACTQDLCVNATGACINPPYTCDDNNPCTTDSCAAGACKNAPVETTECICKEEGQVLCEGKGDVTEDCSAPGNTFDCENNFPGKGYVCCAEGACMTAEDGDVYCGTESDDPGNPEDLGGGPSGGDPDGEEGGNGGGPAGGAAGGDTGDDGDDGDEGDDGPPPSSGSSGSSGGSSAGSSDGGGTGGDNGDTGNSGDQGDAGDDGDNGDEGSDPPGSSRASSAPPPPSPPPPPDNFCGDGNVDSGEECDPGPGACSDGSGQCVTDADCLAPARAGASVSSAASTGPGATSGSSKSGAFSASLQGSSTSRSSRSSFSVSSSSRQPSCQDSDCPGYAAALQQWLASSQTTPRPTCDGPATLNTGLSGGTSGWKVTYIEIDKSRFRQSTTETDRLGSASDTCAYFVPSFTYGIQRKNGTFAPEQEGTWHFGSWGDYLVEMTCNQMNGSPIVAENLIPCPAHQECIDGRCVVCDPPSNNCVKLCSDGSCNQNNWFTAQAAPQQPTVFAWLPGWPFSEVAQAPVAQLTNAPVCIHLQSPTCTADCKSILTGTTTPASRQSSAPGTTGTTGGSMVSGGSVASSAVPAGVPVGSAFSAASSVTVAAGSSAAQESSATSSVPSPGQISSAPFISSGADTPSSGASSILIAVGSSTGSSRRSTGPLCGNFVVDGTTGEQCDQGTGNSDSVPDRCRTDCVLPGCGDGVVDSGEQCDDGNLRSLDGCSASCLSETTIVAGLEFCGNGILEGFEQCDDGNGVNGDGCSAGCSVEFTLVPGASSPVVFSRGTMQPPVAQVGAGAVCGNGVRETGEECDDANVRGLDGCTATCLLESGFCGDGVQQTALGEQCEPVRHDPGLIYACNPTTCRFLSPSCGDGKVDLGEECDAGRSNSDAADSACRSDCGRRRCGDRILDGGSGETCDDGNRIDGDGCSAMCRKEQAAAETIAFPQGSSAAMSAGMPFLPPGTAPGMTPPWYGVPQMPSTTTPWGLPYAQVQPIATSRPPSGETGPAALLLMASGAGAGLGWMRRRRKV